MELPDFARRRPLASRLGRVGTSNSSVADKAGPCPGRINLTAAFGYLVGRWSLANECAAWDAGMLIGTRLSSVRPQGSAIFTREVFTMQASSRRLLTGIVCWVMCCGSVSAGQRVGGMNSAGVAANKALVLRFYDEVWNKGNVEFAHTVFNDDYVRHDLRPTQAQPGPAGQAKIAADFRRAFPDLVFKVDLLLAEGDLVAARWTAAGTNTGKWGALEASGKAATFSGVNIFRFRGGKVAEIWNHRDDLGLMQQVGVPVYAGSTSK